MIIEVADIRVRPGAGSKFAGVVERARSIVESSPGCLGVEVLGGIESPERFVLVIRWATLEDHTEGFRASPAFGDWRAAIGGYFASDPLVEHFTVVAAPR